MSDLPPGWEWATLDELADIQGGIQKQAKRRPLVNKYPFLRVANVSNGRLDCTDMHEIELFEGELPRYRLQFGDLLIVEGNGSLNHLGRATMWQGEIPDCVHQNHLIRARPHRGVDPKYLVHVWNSRTVRSQLEKVGASTSGLHTLSVSKLRPIRIPLPPIVEQRRIVTVVEDHLSRLDAGMASLVKAEARTMRLAHALLADALAQLDCDQLELGALLVEKPINGRSVPTAETGFPVLRLTALKNGRIDLTERKIGAWSERDAEPFLVASGDFFVSRGNGSINLVGRGGLVQGVPDLVAFPDTLIRIRVNSDLLDSGYFSAIWNSPIVRRQIEGQARTTAGIYKINQALLKRIVIPVPVLTDQCRIAGRLADLSEKIDSAQAAIAANGRQGRQLRQSLLSEAFKGRLVAQDASDEPASVLLERVRADRAAQPNLKRVQRGRGTTQEKLP